MKTRFPRLVLAATLSAMLLATQSVFAQRVHEPLLMVNDRAITQHDLDQRALLLSAFGARGNLSALAREQLIDDRLRLFAAQRLQLEVTDQEIQAGVQEFASRRDLTLEQVSGALSARGIAEQTLVDFIEGQLVWRNVVRARFRALASPSEADLDAALEYASSPVQERVLLQEIALSNEVRGEDETQRLATQLSRDLNRGGNFGSAVSRYSQAPSAQRGGRLNWIAASELPAGVATQVLALLPGEVSAPIPVPGGLSIIKLLDIQQVPIDPETSQQTMTYSQLVLPLARNANEDAVAAATSQLETIRTQTEFCIDIDNRAAEFGDGSGRSEPTPLPAVPSALRERVAGLEAGGIEIFRDAVGVRLLMVCARSGETSPEEREALRRRLFNQRMSAFGQGYLQELRGDAVIIEK